MSDSLEYLLGELVDIATKSESYETIDRTRIESLCLELKEKTPVGTRFESKTGLIEKLIDMPFKNETTGSFKTIIENFVYFTKDLKIKDIGKFVDKSPVVFGLNIEENIKLKVEYFKEIGVKDIGKFVSMAPNVFSHSIEDNMRPKVEYIKEIGVKDIGKFVSKSPNVFNLSIEDNMKPKVEYLRKIGVKDVGKFASRYPSVFGLSIEDKMKPIAEYLKKIGVGDIGKFVSLLPAVFGQSIEENMKPKVRYLKEIGVKDIGKFVSRCPAVLSLSIEDNMKPKVEFYKSKGYTIRNIENFPQGFSYSLEKRIEPRFAYLKHIGKHNVGLNNILILGDSAFSKRFGGHEQAYSNFLEEYKKK